MNDLIEDTDRLTMNRRNCAGFYEVLNTVYKSIITFQLNEYLYVTIIQAKLVYLKAFN